MKKLRVSLYLPTTKRQVKNKQDSITSGSTEGARVAYLKTCIFKEYKNIYKVVT
jgi:hypothetical protein